MWGNKLQKTFCLVGYRKSMGHEEREGEKTIKSMLLFSFYPAKNNTSSARRKMSESDSKRRLQTSTKVLLKP